VGNKDHSLVPAGVHHGFVHPVLGNGIQRGGGLIQNHDFAGPGEHPGDGDFLIFPAGEHRAVVVEFPGQGGILLAGEGLHLFPDAAVFHPLRRVLPLLRGDVVLEQNVLHHAEGEDPVILEHRAE